MPQVKIAFIDQAGPRGKQESMELAVVGALIFKYDPKKKDKGLDMERSILISLIEAGFLPFFKSFSKYRSLTKSGKFKYWCQKNKLLKKKKLCAWQPNKISELIERFEANDIEYRANVSLLSNNNNFVNKLIEPIYSMLTERLVSKLQEEWGGDLVIITDNNDGTVAGIFNSIIKENLEKFRDLKVYIINNCYEKVLPGGMAIDTIVSYINSSIRESENSIGLKYEKLQIKADDIVKEFLKMRLSGYYVIRGYLQGSVGIGELLREKSSIYFPYGISRHSFECIPKKSFLFSSLIKIAQKCEEIQYVYQSENRRVRRRGYLDIRSMKANIFGHVFDLNNIIEETRSVSPLFNANLPSHKEEGDPKGLLSLGNKATIKSLKIDSSVKNKHFRPGLVKISDVIKTRVGLWCELSRKYYMSNDIDCKIHTSKVIDILKRKRYEDVLKEIKKFLEHNFL